MADDHDLLIETRAAVQSLDRRMTDSDRLAAAAASRIETKLEQIGGAMGRHEAKIFALENRPAYDLTPVAFSRLAEEHDEMYGEWKNSVKGRYEMFGEHKTLWAEYGQRKSQAATTRWFVPMILQIAPSILALITLVILLFKLG